MFEAHSAKGNGHNGLSQVHCTQTRFGEPKHSKGSYELGRLLSWRDIRNQRIDTEYDSAMKCILAMAP